MASLEIRLNEAALSSLAAQAGDADLNVRANAVLNAARRGAPVDRGQLRASLTIEFSRDANGPFARIGSNLPYAIFVHEGTGIYGPSGQPIKPVRGRFLRFTPRGASGPVFARQVSGSPGRPFLLEALDAAR